MFGLREWNVKNHFPFSHWYNQLKPVLPEHTTLNSQQQRFHLTQKIVPYCMWFEISFSELFECMRSVAYTKWIQFSFHMLGDTDRNKFTAEITSRLFLTWMLFDGACIHTNGAAYDPCVWLAFISTVYGVVIRLKWMEGCFRTISINPLNSVLFMLDATIVTILNRFTVFSLQVSIDGFGIVNEWKVVCYDCIQRRRKVIWENGFSWIKDINFSSNQRTYRSSSRWVILFCVRISSINNNNRVFSFWDRANSIDFEIETF